MGRGMSKAERLQEMIWLYLQRAYTDIEMAERLGVDRTTVFRDRTELETAHVFSQDEQGRYRLERMQYMPNIKVNLHEALALYLATRRASRQTRIAQPHTASALEKLAIALKQPMTERLARAAGSILEQSADPERVRVLEIITQGWAEQRKVQIIHQALRARKASEYIVHPYLIEPSLWSDGAYVIGYCETFQKVATFKIERIEKAELKLERFNIPEDFDEAELLRYAWGIWYGENEPTTVRLRFAAGEAARRVKESIWHPTQVLEEETDGGVIWQAQVAEWQEMLPWVRGWGADCEVLSPESLRKKLQADVRKMARVYEIGDREPSQTCFFAHRKEDEDQVDWQPLSEHLKNTAEMAREFGRAANVSDIAYIAGLAHDLGKYSQEFQQRLEGKRIHIDHSTAGAKELQHLLKGTPQEAFTTLLAYSIIGHHSGLLDYGDETDLAGDGTVVARLKTDVCNYSAYNSELDLSNLPFPQRLHIRPMKGKLGFSLSFLTRIVYSALVDADFQETQEYMQGKKPRGEHDAIPTLRDKLNVHLRQFDNPTSDINRKRTETLKACCEKAQEKPGFFRLTVPTGGGKTLASMAFALNHAATHGLRRVIYVIPYTTIIEQNAAVFKDILGEENVLEHHSNFDWEQKKREVKESVDDLTNSTYAKLKLAAENWDIPIVVTTNVQFFESLFASKSSRCRKLHNIAQSVIIFDEAQMLPREYMLPAMSAVWELVTNYGASAVFCTATQPNLERFLPEGTQLTELAPEPQELFDFYRRVEVKNIGTLPDDELLGRLNAHEQALCIVNTRRHASGLFGGLQGEGNYHLSTLMCPAHRKQKLAEIRKRLEPESKQPCRVVSTTVMEAGIDLDFPVGYRALTGLDSINQAAGRVNREMKRSVSEMFVFEPKSEFVMRTPRYISQAVEISRRVLREYSEAPISIPAIAAYFDQLYSLQDHQAFDYKIILGCFDDNNGRFKFQTAARLFQVIEDATETVIIPYNPDAEDLINELKFTPYPSSTLRKLQPYTVSIYQGEFEKLSAKGVILTIAETYAVLNPDHFKEYYHPETGLLVPASSGGDGLFF